MSYNAATVHNFIQFHPTSLGSREAAPVRLDDNGGKFPWNRLGHKGRKQKHAVNFSKSADVINICQCS